MPGHYGGRVDTSQDVTLKGEAETRENGIPVFVSGSGQTCLPQLSSLIYFLMPAFALASVFLLHHDYVILIGVKILLR